MWELLLRSRKFIAGFLILIAFILLGTVATLFVANPLTIDLSVMNQPPSLAHFLGTTEFGQDVFAQLCYGVGNSLLVGFITGGLGTLLAVGVGAIGPYIGGIADKISNLFTNLVLTIPLIPLFIIIAAVIQGLSLPLIGIILAVTSWPWAARSIRSQVLTLKEREFINLARMSGETSGEIVVAEILPNMFAYIMMVFVILSGTGILAESALSTVGVSATSNVTLGYMLYHVRQASTIAHWWSDWWWFIPPGLTLTILLTAFFLMHAGMDEVFNPRLREI